MESTTTPFTEVTTPEMIPDYDYDGQLSNHTKAADIAADPNQGHCLVENNNHTVEFAHCIARKHMKDEKMVCVRPLFFILGSIV